MASVNHDWLWLCAGADSTGSTPTTQNYSSLSEAHLPLLHSHPRPIPSYPHLSVQLFGVLSLTEATLGGGATQTLLRRPAAAVEVLLGCGQIDSEFRVVALMSVDQELKYCLDLFSLLLVDVF